MKFPVPVLLLLSLATPLAAQGTKADFERAKRLAESAHSALTGETISPEWSDDGKTLTYAIKGSGKERRYQAVDLATGRRTEAFDHEALAKALAEAGGPKAGAAELPLSGVVARDGIVLFQAGGKGWSYEVSSKKVSPSENAVKASALLAPEDAPRNTRRGGDPQPLVFENATPAPVEIRWIDFSGEAHSYGKIDPGSSSEQSTYAGHLWRIVAGDGTPLAAIETPDYPSVAKITGRVAPTKERKPRASRESQGSAFVRGRDLFLRNPDGGEPSRLAEGGNEASFKPSLQESPDGRHLVAWHAKDVTERKVTLVESSPRDQLQPKTRTIHYTKPGDPISQPFPRLFDLSTRKEIPVDRSLFPNPWEITEGAWSPDSTEYTFVYNQRGHQLMRILGVRADDGSVRVIHEELSETFLDYSQKFYLKRLPETREILWMSERDGWNHLYLIDEAVGRVKTQITRGAWNVRAVESVDEQKRSLIFRAMGRIPGQDPYYTHYVRVNFDGGGLMPLTASDGDHRIEFSPDGRFLIDRWSRVNQPPVTELRRADDGGLVCELGRTDDAERLKTGWSRPEPLAFKGRDGRTDIHGVLIRPSNFDPSKRYPVLECIYSGPHDFFVPKRYTPWGGMNALAELGFIVVQVDGMGTNWRGRAFHDVAWKNLADAGLPDHIAWIKAAAADRPWMDLGRVGIYGGSAGGQNALSALLHQGDFYKAGVADCGCHDNRMDKIWWNEAWMGWPVDDSYARNSNVTDAAKLQGKLMLVVGELDDNVDPSSTLQVANALQKADKDFDLLIVTGAGHGAAETPYGSRRRADFFIRHLLGVEPRG